MSEPLTADKIRVCYELDALGGIAASVVRAGKPAARVRALAALCQACSWLGDDAQDAAVQVIEAALGEWRK